MKRHFLVALDFSECSKFALEWTLQHFVFQPSQDSLTLLSIVEPAPSLHSNKTVGGLDQHVLEDTAHSQLSRLWELVRKRFPLDEGVKVELRVVTGQPKEALVDIGNTEHPTMIIVGNHGKSGSNRELGSVSDFCMRKCKAPVIVVKEGASS